MTTPDVKVSALPAADAVDTTDEVVVNRAGVTQRASVSLVRGTVGGASYPGVASLDSFAGATDEAKLTAALSYAAAQTYVPPIALSNRLYTFTTTRASFEGLSIIGPPRSSNAEKGTKNNACRVDIGGLANNTAWIDSGITSGSRFNVNLHNLAFRGGGTEGILSTGGTSQLYSCHMSGITTSGVRVSAGKVLMTLALFDGYWELNNHTDTTFQVGGSDNTFWPDGGAIDSPTLNSPANGTPHVFFDFCEKTTCGQVYMTAEGNWGGFRQDGPDYNTVSGNLGGPIFYYGMRLEGRNAGSPCNGALFKLNGGTAIVESSWTSYAMASPPTGHDGVFDVGSGGNLDLSKCFYDKATSVAETVPYVHFSTTTTNRGRVSGIKCGGKGGVFTGTPRVTNTTGTATHVRVDSSVTGSGVTVGL